MCRRAVRADSCLPTIRRLNLALADDIRKRGFLRWHERQLIEAHASLVTAFLCVIAVAVSLDQFRWREAGIKPLWMLLVIAGGTAVCVVAVRHYFKTLFCAEHYAQQAVCGNCATYGRIEILSDHGGELKVRCRRCDWQWTLKPEGASAPAGPAL